jgi:mannose-6-phosphate isomerase-like protein (cupin superfamily)
MSFAQNVMTELPHYRPSSLCFSLGRAHGGLTDIAFSRFVSRETGSRFDHVDYVELPPGADIGFHRHLPGEEEIYIIMDGNGKMTLEGNTFAVERGDVIVNPPGGAHALLNDSEGPMRLVVVQCSAP